MPGRACWMPGRACWMPGRALWMPGSALDAGLRALHAGPRALDAGTIWQDIKGCIGAFWAAIAADNAGHGSTPAYSGTSAATTLFPSSAAVATILIKPQQRLPGRRAGRHNKL